MSIIHVHWDLRAIWASLSVPGRLYVLCLLAGVIYSAVSLARLGLQLRGLRQDAKVSSQPKMAAAIETLRQLHTLLLLLLGVFTANEIFGEILAIRYSYMSLSALGLEVFDPAIAVVFVSIATLLILHIAQWVVARRIYSVRPSSQAN